MLKINIFFFFIFSLVDAQSKSFSSLSKYEARKQATEYYKDYKSKIIKKRSKEMEDYLIKIDSLEMKFELKFFGKKPKSGWSLYFSLHGGGGVS